MVDNRKLLAELNELLADEDGKHLLRQTVLEFIHPKGGHSFAVDSDGNVVGIKIGRIDHSAQEILDKICQFQYLRRLVLFFDVPCEIPPAIQVLKHLQFLWLGGEIRKLPTEFLSIDLPIYVNNEPLELRETENSTTRAELEVDTYLDSGEEQIQKERTPELIRATLGSARFQQLRTQVSNIRGIVLKTPTLEDPPLEIARKGREAIESYFRERSSDVLPLNELKVLLVGHGSAGKTSLVKRVFGEDFDAKESQTHGINIRSRLFEIAEGKEVKLNFWDFGGQEIMHATHQFFLSKRSMYILVLDGRKEEDAEYWLQHIESFGSDSPVMVVLNKIDENPSFEVNRRFLKGKYTGIIDFFRLSCATGQGIKSFSTSLTEELSKVSMLQTLWPGGWFRVKQRLESLGTAYISLNDYIAICKEENVTQQKNQELLVDFLNDLGVVLHFKDIELLDTHVLDPRWVTEAVYRIITSKILADNKGILRFNQLHTALEPRKDGECIYPADKHQYIINLMLKFELCYRLGDNAILVPDLLDIQEPQTNFDDKDALRFVFEYTYLPKSIMPRFIVRMNQDIKDSKRWRTGVLLEEKSFQATALIRADEKAKRIYVYVNGQQKRDYFAVIRKVISDLNSSFEKLPVTHYVPLPNAPDVLIDYLELLGHEVAGRDEIFVGRMARAYDVQTLLNGIEKKATRQIQTGPTIFNIRGDLFANSSVNGVTRFNAGETIEIRKSMNRKPPNWEKIIVYATGFLFLGVVSFLAIRNQPVADPNFVVMLRIVLSLVVAVFGATVPGLLRVDFSLKGVTIRAIGALALFVIAFLLTPKVL